VLLLSLAQEIPPFVNMRPVSWHCKQGSPGKESRRKRYLAVWWCKPYQNIYSIRLIDIYRISVHPIALGKGKPLFENLKERQHLKLIKTNVFKSGVVQLIYEPDKTMNR